MWMPPPSPHSSSRHGAELWRTLAWGVSEVPIPPPPAKSVGDMRLLAMAAMALGVGRQGLVHKGVCDAALRCPRLGWYRRRGLFPEERSDHAAALMEQGRWFEQHVVQTALPLRGARKAPVGVPSERAAARTADLMAVCMAARQGAVVQPTFLAGDVVARADAVVFNENGLWDVVEIKSVLHTNVASKVSDLGFTVHVAGMANVPVHRAQIIAVNRDFRTDNDVPLHREVDCTDAVHASSAEVARDVERTRTLTEGEDPPPPVAVVACKHCAARGECWPREAHPIWELPRVRQRHLNQILERTASLRAEDAPVDLLTPQQQRFQRALARGDDAPPLVTDAMALRRAVDQLGAAGKVHYLDFEAAMLLRPPFPGLAPMEVLVAQYSLHTVFGDLRSRTEPSRGANTAPRRRGAGLRLAGLSVGHAEYLARGGEDCRGELLEHLLRHTAAFDASNETPVVVYSSYEARCLEALAQRFPALASATLRLRARLVDLEKVVGACVVHARMRGRTSLKVVLPALVAGRDGAYAAGGLADGGAAAAALAQLSAGGLEPATEAALRQALLEYCALDTWALAELHWALCTLATAGAVEVEEDDDDSRRSAAPRGAAVAQGVVETPGHVAEAGAEDMATWTVVQLKAALRARGLRVSGRKADLLTRLRTHRCSTPADVVAGPCAAQPRAPS